MNPRKISLEQLHQAEAKSVLPSPQNASDIVQAIIKVKKADYVPRCVHLRASISPHLFTGEFKFGDLRSIEQDAKVESVALNQQLKLTE